MGINGSGVNTNMSTTTELIVIDGATIDSTTLVVDATNDRVGIGTVEPGTVLQIESETPYITLKNSTAENTAGGCESRIIGEDHANVALGQIEISHSGSSDDTKGKMILSTHTGSSLTAAVTIDDTQKATFAGNVDTTGDITAGGGDVTLGTAGNTTATTISTITNTGTTAGKDLTVSAGSTTTNGNNLNGGDLVLSSGGGDGTGTSSIQFKTKVSGTDAAAERMRIHTDGNVGIGDTAPGTLLQLSGADAYLTLKNTTAENSDGGAETKIIFEDHANAALGQVEVHHNGSSDDTKGQMILSSHDGSSLVSGIEITEGVVTKLNVAADTVAQASDHILFFDGGATGAPKVESIDHFLSAIAGSGISVSSSQLTASSGGASALNDLSDVSYGSGDLVITSLDTLTTSDSAHNAAGTDVVIRGGNTTAGTSDDQAGGDLTIQGGQGKGTGAGGDIIFQTAKGAGSSADSLNALATRVTINQKGEMLFANSQEATIGLDDTADDTAGQALKIKGGSTTGGSGSSNLAGGAITFVGGAGKGTGAGGEILFNVIPASPSGGTTLNTTQRTQMTISQSGVVVNDAGIEACDFRVQGGDWPNLLNVNAGLNQVGVGHDESDPGEPSATLYVRNKSDNSGGNVPLVLLDNDNVDVIALDIDAANTTANVITVNADSMTTATAFFMSLDGLTTGKGFEILCDRGHSGSKTLIYAENIHNTAINTTLLHLKNSANQNVAPHALLEYAGDQTDHPVILELRRSDTGSDADGMDLGVINFSGTVDDDSTLTYAQIFAEVQDFTDGTEDGVIELKTQVAGTLTTQLKIDKGGVSFPTGKPCPNTVTTATSVTIATTDNGRTYIIKELGGHQTFTLPSPTANFKVTLLTVMNNLTYDIIVKTAAVGNRIAAGLFHREDQGADSEHGWDDSPQSYIGVIANTYTGSGHGSEENANRVTFTNACAGSKFDFYSDGTVWYCKGEIMMTASTSETGEVEFDLWS